MPSGIRKPVTKAQAKKYVKAVLAKKSYDAIASSLPDAMYDATTARSAVVPGMTRAAGYFGRYRPGGELKFFDFSVVPTASSATGSIYLASMNLIPVGTGPSERIGRRVTLKSIGLRVTFILQAGIPNDHVRLILYQDMQCNGAAPAVTDILQSADVDSYLNLANSDRFRILRDMRQFLNSQSNILSGGVLVPAGDMKTHESYQVFSLPIDFSTGTGVSIADVKSNNFGLLLISEYSGVTTAELHGRIRYSDN